MTIIIRPFAATDRSDILRLNEESVSVLSPMDGQRFDLLEKQARLVWVAEKNRVIAGFIMGFDEHSSYDSTNYGWFKTRFTGFLYVDRIVIDREFRGLGIGQLIYSELDKWASGSGIDCLVAEVDIEPPNQPSLEFHRVHGFVEVGQNSTSPNKCVSMQRKSL